MAISDLQRSAQHYVIDALRNYFRERNDLYVTGGLPLYYDEHNPRAVVLPDVLVVAGVTPHARTAYCTWQEQGQLLFVLEVTALADRFQDLGLKRGAYRYLGVRELWLFAPEEEWLTPRLQGFRLIDEDYQRLPTGVAAGGHLSLHSAALGLDLRYVNNQLQLVEPQENRRLLTYDELWLAHQRHQQPPARAIDETILEMPAITSARLAEEHPQSPLAQTNPKATAERRSRDGDSQCDDVETLR